jgi:hypothetical protein
MPPIPGRTETWVHGGKLNKLLMGELALLSYFVPPNNYESLIFGRSELHMLYQWTNDIATQYRACLLSCWCTW